MDEKETRKLGFGLFALFTAITQVVLVMLKAFNIVDVNWIIILIPSFCLVLAYSVIFIISIIILFAISSLDKVVDSVDSTDYKIKKER